MRYLKKKYIYLFELKNTIHNFIVKIILHQNFKDVFYDEINNI